MYLWLIKINVMGALELREKLIEQFNEFIQDDSKLPTLNGIFDSLNTKDISSSVPMEHYKIVEERRRKYHANENKGASWDKVMQKLKDKYGF